MSRYREPYTLYKRGDYWYYRTYTPDGIRTAGKTTGQKNKTAARDYCNKLYLSGSLWTSEKTFGEYAKHFYDDNSPYVRDRITPLTENTLRGYRIKMNQYIMPYFSKYKIADINYTVLKRFRIQMLEKYAPSNVVSTMSTLKHIIDNAYRDRLIPVNPYDYLETFNVQKKERDAFTYEEIIYIYKNIPEEFKNIILLMACTGLRISEAIGITSEDFCSADDFEYIHLWRQFNNHKYKDLKNKELRDIPIIPEIKQLIGFDPTRLSALYRYFEPLKKQLTNFEERKLCFHSLRHYFITASKSAGINPLKVETIAGHSLRGITKIYTNFKVTDLKDILSWQKDFYNKFINDVK